MLDFSKANEWIITETDFNPSALGKVEANFCLGNGYLGLRSATEERYTGETRDLLVAGTFNRFSPEEVTELPNAADVTNIELTLDGVRFDLTQGEILVVPEVAAELLLFRQGFLVDIVRAVQGVDDPVGFPVEEIRIVGVRVPQGKGQAFPSAELIALFQNIIRHTVILSSLLSAKSIYAVIPTL